MAEPLDQQMIKRFLLGELPEGEREAAAARIFESDESFDAVREVEDDLVDAMARGELTVAEGVKVRTFLAESSQSDRLAIARVLAGMRRAAEASPVAIRTFIGLAAAILMILVGSFYLARSRGHVEVSSTPPAAAPAPSPASAIFAFVAPPGTTRGASRAFSVRVPEGTQLVQVQVDIEAGFPGYEVTLRTTSGRVINTLKAAAAGRFEVPIPASLLRSGQYEVEVTGVRGTQREPVQYHYFSVE